MVTFYESVSPEHHDWILEQPVFFVASAPSTGRHINLSPKGLPSSSFALLTPNEAAYVDATGSGNETISHLRENGRLTVMFCSFDAAPRILRLFCTAEVIEWNEPAFRPALSCMGLAEKCVEGARAVILLHIFKAQTSCGFGVPRLALTMDPNTHELKPYLQDRETLGHWTNKKISKNELHSYQRDWNHDSLDGLPGLRAAMRSRGMWAVNGRIWFCRHQRGLELSAVMVLSMFTTVVMLWLTGLVNVGSSYST